MKRTLNDLLGQLDQVLSYLDNKEIAETFQEINVESGINDYKTTESILLKLIRDKYVDVKPIYRKEIAKETTIVKTDEFVYYISIEGLVFKAQGGYAQQETNRMGLGLLRF